MTRHDLFHSYGQAGGAETGTTVDALIRPGLRQAFPLPSKGDHDERFHVLLNALAERTGANGWPAD